MNIALCHFRVGETDGVSLEMEKWKKVLEKMGHNVYLLAGSLGTTEGYVIPELHYKHELNDKFVRNAYDSFVDYEDEEDFKKEVMDFAKKIEDGLKKFIKEYKIEVLVPNNIWSLGWGIPAAIAINNVVKEMGIECVAHHHDFYWERERYSKPTCKFVEEVLEEYFPPKHNLIKHVVINEIAKEEIKKRKGLDATIVPNVFDFDVPTWKVDEYNKDFRKSIGLRDNDILVLQATRITERKAIELAIDVVSELKKEDGTLEGNYTLRKIKNTIVNEVLSTIDNPGQYSTLGDIGFDIERQRGGAFSLSLDEEDFREKLDEDELSLHKLFAYDGDGDGLLDDGGYAISTRSYLDGFTRSVSGFFYKRDEDATERISDIKIDVSDMEADLTKAQEKKFYEMAAQISQLQKMQQQQEYLSQVSQTTLSMIMR